jgi:hypothetical protein
MQTNTQNQNFGNFFASKLKKKNVSLNLWSEYLIEATLFLEILKPHFRNNFTRQKNVLKFLLF